MRAGCCSSYINICSLRNEVLQHICLTKVCSVVKRLPPTFQGPVYIFSLEKRRTLQCWYEKKKSKLSAAVTSQKIALTEYLRSPFYLETETVIVDTMKFSDKQSSAPSSPSTSLLWCVRPQTVNHAAKKTDRNSQNLFLSLTMLTTHRA